MPPMYRPLEGSGIPVMPTGFGQSPVPVDFGDLIDKQRQDEALQQARDIALAQQQRDEAIRQQIGEQAKAQGEAFTPEAGLRLAERLNLEGGNPDKALTYEKALSDRVDGDPLSPELLASYRALGLPLPEGSTERTARNMNQVRGTSAYQSIVNDPTRANNRTLQGVLMDQKATGTQIRPPTESMVNKIGAGDAFNAYIQNVEDTYMPYVSENRGVRFLTAAANPNSAEARILNELKLAAKQAALSMEPRVTDQDYQIIADISTPTDLDTNETTIDRMHRLAMFVRTRMASDVNVAQAGGYNMEGLKDRSPVTIPGSAKDPNALAQSLSQPVPPRAGLTYGGIDEATQLPIWISGK